MLHDPVRDLRTKCEMLEEENRQLQAHIARLTGQHDARRVRKAFNFTETEAKMVAALIHRGACDYDTLKFLAYSDSELLTISDPDWALRSHMKRIRKKTRPHGIDFLTVYGFGFEMSDEARRLARALLHDGASK
jgi:DNA-binding response OmpR family regulator